MKKQTNPFLGVYTSLAVCLVALILVGYFDMRKYAKPAPVVYTKDQEHAPTMPTFKAQLCNHANAWAKMRNEALPVEFVNACAGSTP